MLPNGNQAFRVIYMVYTEVLAQPNIDVEQAQHKSNPMVDEKQELGLTGIKSLEFLALFHSNIYSLKTCSIGNVTQNDHIEVCPMNCLFEIFSEDPAKYDESWGDDNRSDDVESEDKHPDQDQ